MSYNCQQHSQPSKTEVTGATWSAAQAKHIACLDISREGNEQVWQLLPSMLASSKPSLIMGGPYISPTLRSVSSSEVNLGTDRTVYQSRALSTRSTSPASDHTIVCDTSAVLFLIICTPCYEGSRRHDTPSMHNVAVWISVLQPGSLGSGKK
jgi:hypothetical protein